MTLSLRIRRIREISGWKQSAIASSLNISQQGYSCLEKRAEYAKLKTLRKFCDVMNVNMAFLMATDIEITEENIRTVGAKGFAEMWNNYSRLEKKVDVLQDLFGRGAESLSANHAVASAA